MAQDEWTIVSIVDYVAYLKAAELFRAEDEGRVPSEVIKLSRRMQAFLKQSVQQSIERAYEGSYEIEWAEPHIEKLIRFMPIDREPVKYPYLILAGSLLDQLKVKTPDSYSDSDYSWKKEAFEAIASGVGVTEEFADHWFGEVSGYAYLQ